MVIAVPECVVHFLNGAILIYFKVYLGEELKFTFYQTILAIHCAG